MWEQLVYLRLDLIRILGKNKLRIIHIWMSRAFIGIFIYRFERALYKLLGKPYEIFRVILLPLFNLAQAYSNLDLNYKSDIKGGILVLHPSAGIVISGYSVIGSNLTLTGGNIIGAKPGCKYGEIEIGNNVSLGANSVILGPIKLGNQITIGASACVIRDCLNDNKILVGIPAYEL